MTDRNPWQADFVRRLRDLIDPVRPDRAALAELRRSLGADPTRALVRVGRLFRGVPEYALDTAALVAGLFALHPATAADGNLGDAFRRLKAGGGSESIEKRFVALVDAAREDLPGRLRQAVSLLRSKDVPVPWPALLEDLLRWDSPNRTIQRQWARAYWQETTDEAEEPEIFSPTVP